MTTDELIATLREAAEQDLHRIVVRTFCGTELVVEVPEVVELRERLAEAVARQRFADHVELQRQIGRVHVRRLLDEFARSVGAPTPGDDRRAAARARLIERQHPDHPDFIGRRP